MNAIRKAYYLQEIELAVLLSAMGQRQIYGYKLQDLDNVDERRIKQTLFSMMRKEMLMPVEKGLVIAEQYRELLQGIIDARKLLVSADSKQKFPELYLYMTDQVIAVQSSGQSGIMLKIEKWEKMQAIEQLMQCGFRVPSLLQEKTAYDEKAIALKSETSKLYALDKQQLLECPQIELVLLEMDIVKQKKVSQILLIREGIDDQIMIADNKETIRYHYSEQKMWEILSQYVGGAK